MKPIFFIIMWFLGAKIFEMGILYTCSDSGEVLSKMSAGDFFGEIGILNLDGGINR